MNTELNLRKTKKEIKNGKSILMEMGNKKHKLLLCRWQIYRLSTGCYCLVLWNKAQNCYL